MCVQEKLSLRQYPFMLLGLHSGRMSALKPLLRHEIAPQLRALLFSRSICSTAFSKQSYGGRISMFWKPKQRPIWSAFVHHLREGDCLPLGGSLRDGPGPALCTLPTWRFSRGRPAAAAAVEGRRCRTASQTGRPRPTDLLPFLMPRKMPDHNGYGTVGFEGCFFFLGSGSQRL